MKVLNEISRGGFGRVERVKLGEATIAARKVFDPVPDILAAADIPKLKKRFQREVQVQSLLSSDYFMKVLDFDLETETPWFIIAFSNKT